jgi:hypothetical protein
MVFSNKVQCNSLLIEDAFTNLEKSDEDIWEEIWDEIDGDKSYKGDHYWHYHDKSNETAYW